MEGSWCESERFSVFPLLAWNGFTGQLNPKTCLSVSNILLQLYPFLFSLECLFAAGGGGGILI